MSSPARRALRLVSENQWQIRLSYRKFRQKVFIARVRALAMWERAEVKFDLAPDLQIGKKVRVIVWPGTVTTVKIGTKSKIGDNVTFHMKGGSMIAGVRTDIRPGCAIQIEGKIALDGENTISYGCVLHSGDSIHLGYAAIMAEYASVADSTHFFTDADDPVGENVKFAPIEIGRNSFLCPRVSVGRGVTIGPWTIVGPSSVVAKDLPAGVFASGVPAEVVRNLDHPWMKDIENNVPGAPDPEWPSRVKHLP